MGGLTVWPDWSITYVSDVFHLHSTLSSITYSTSYQWNDNPLFAANFTQDNSSKPWPWDTAVESPVMIFVPGCRRSKGRLKVTLPTKKELEFYRTARCSSFYAIKISQYPPSSFPLKITLYGINSLASLTFGKDGHLFNHLYCHGIKIVRYHENTKQNGFVFTVYGHINQV